MQKSRYHNYERRAGMREQMRERRRRTDRRLIYVAMIMGVCVIVAVFLGRGLFYVSDVGRFVNTLDQLSTAQIKAELDHFSRGLTDINPFVRSAAMTAMKAATRADLGSNPDTWLAWWRKNRDRWEYGQALAPAEPEIPPGMDPLGLNPTKGITVDPDPEP